MSFSTCLLAFPNQRCCSIHIRKVRNKLVSMIGFENVIVNLELLDLEQWF